MMDKIRVLIADDSLVVRRVIMEELAAQPDLQVAGVASNGKLALERFAELQPDLVILDIEMPEVDGLAALVRIRRTHPRTPIIMFSSLTIEGAAATFEALARGATDFFAKPSGGGGLEAARRVIREQLIPAIRELGLRAKKAHRTIPSTTDSPAAHHHTMAPGLSSSAAPHSSTSPSGLANAVSGSSAASPSAFGNPPASGPGVRGDVSTGQGARVAGWSGLTSNPSSSAPAVPPVGSGSSRLSGTETSMAGAANRLAAGSGGIRDLRGRKSPIDLLAIGASTGGPNALAELFTRIPAQFPIPIVIVQHMPPMFTQLLAERLTRGSLIPTEEAKSGTILEPGHAYVAPGDFHVTVVRSGTRNRLQVDQNPAENGCRPSFDPLLRSVATLFGPNSMAVVLTGMGQDGLKGCEAVRAVAGQILVQDEASSVVWGMPGHVARAGLADQILPLPHLADEIVRRVRLSRG